MSRKQSIVRLAPVAAGAIIAAVGGGLLLAGPLDPPAGPVTSTYKTLTDVEPRIAINATNTPGDNDATPSLLKITAPGSYYLTGNITGVVAKHGIEIAASGVTLDLMGFDLAGVPAMGVFDGVSATVASLTNIAVVNGSVRNWGEDGVNLGTFGVNGCRVEGVQASGNVRVGIYAGSNAVVSRCTASGGQFGVATLNGSNVSDCSTRGISVNGIFAGAGSTITKCTAHLITGDGIYAEIGSTVTNCLAYSNTGTGIFTSNGSTVTNCSAYFNTGDGISVSGGCTVAECTVRLNTLDGIRCSSGSIIRNNTCSNNGNGAGDGAGIHATGNDNRIEGNNCAGADRGIHVDFAGNIIIRNTCSGNTTANWVIVANNYYGPIIDRTGFATAAVNGPVAAGTLATPDPHANFSY